MGNGELGCAELSQLMTQLSDRAVYNQGRLVTSLINGTRHALTTSAPPTVHVRHNPGCQCLAAYSVAKIKRALHRRPVS